MKTELPLVKTFSIDHAAAGYAIRALRIKKKKSLRAVARAMEISPPFLSDLERGRRNWSEERFQNAITEISKP